MRFIVDVKDETYARTLAIMLNEAESQGKVKILDRGDPAQRLQAMVNQIKEAVEHIRASGIDTEILIAYIHAKTRVPNSVIKKVLDAEIDFLNRMGQIDVPGRRRRRE